MKRPFTILALLSLTLFFSSCEKCATCTSVSDDPQTEGQTITSEVCGVGREYTDQVEIYERTNWECTEQ